MKRENTRLFFDGLLMHNMIMSTHRPDREPLYCGRDTIVGHILTWQKSETVLSFDITTQNHYETEQVVSWGQSLRWCDNNFVVLGSGMTCPHCDSFNPSGSVWCVHCGAPMERKDFVAPKDFPFRVSYISRDDATIFQEWDTVHIEMVGFDVDLEEHIMPWVVQPKSLIKLPIGLSLNPDLYICQFCGAITQKGSSCNGCGGQRLPWSEVMRIERKCLYCDRETKGNLVCNYCGASISAIAARDVFEQDEQLKVLGNRFMR